MAMKIFKISFLVSLLLIIPSKYGSCLAAGVALKTSTPQEKWVLEQVRNGKVADLQERFKGEPAGRRLPAPFLEKLLTGGFKNLTIPRSGVQINHAVIDGPLDLKYAEINHFVALVGCVFEKSVDLQNSQFKKPLDFTRCAFRGPATFEEMKVEGDAVFNDAIFDDEVAWTAAVINGKFYAERAQFRCENKEAIFNGIKVTYSVFLNDAKFHGPVNFILAQMGRHLLANGAVFSNPGKSADFKNIKVGMSVYLKGAIFKAPVTFKSSEVGEYFRVNDIKLLHQKPAVFANMKIGQKAIFELQDVKCDLDLSYSNFYDLEIKGTLNEAKNSDKKINIPKLILSGSVINRDLMIDQVAIGNLEMNYLQVKGVARLNEIKVVTSANFLYSAFQTLDFQNVVWPEKEKGENFRKVYLNELTYNSLNINKLEDADYDNKDFQAIKDFVEASPFNTQSYMQMEALFKRIGRESWSKEVFIQMNDRELAEKMPWWDLRRWLEWFFWGRIAGYGRAPFRVFFLSLALIILGDYLFDPEHMAEKRDTGGKKYKVMVMRFFISLDRFLPIDLGLARHWDSKVSSFFIWFYYHFLKIIGWILIPIALASIYSQLK